MKQLETKILSLYRDKGFSALNDLEIYMYPSSPATVRTTVRNIISRIEVNKEGHFFLKDKT